MGLQILIVSEYFAPVLSIASVRWTKLAKHLVQDLGYEVDLLTNEKDFTGRSIRLRHYQIDSTLVPDLECIRDTHTIRMPVRGIFARLAIPLVRSCRHTSGAVVKRLSGKRGKANKPLGKHRTYEDELAMRVTTRLVDALDHSIGKAKIPRGLDFSSYDVVVSSFAPKWAHIIGRRIKETHKRAIWLADYRDPLKGHADLRYDMSNSENRHFPNVVTGSADAILGVSEGCLHDLELETGTRAYVVPNGFDGEVWRGLRTKTKLFEITYTGSIYSKNNQVRGISTVLRSLLRLADAGRIDLSDVHMKYAGSTPELFESQAKGFESRVTMRSLGLVSREEALRLQRESSLLVFLTWNTQSSKGVVTGKIFEYMASGTPIVGYVAGSEPGAVATEMIERSRTGVCVEEADPEDAQRRLDAFIADKYAEWKATGTTSVDPDYEYIETFSYASRARQVDEIIRELIAKRSE